MRTRHIEIFHAVVVEKSVSAAAKRLKVSQPSVTKMLRQAEDDLGYPLFDRVKGRLQLTEEGRALSQEVHRAFSAFESVQHLSRRLKTGAELEFRIAATPALGHQALPDGIATYGARHPKARFQISTQHSRSLLASLGKAAYGFDLGFTFGAEGAPANVASVDLGKVALAGVFVEGALMLRRPLKFSDLHGRRMIALEEDEPLGHILADQFREQRVIVDAPLRVQTYTLACALAASTGAIAVVDALTAGSFVGSKAGEGMSVVPFEPSVTLPVTAVYPLETGLPIAARELIDCFKQALAKRMAVIDAMMAV